MRTAKRPKVPNPDGHCQLVRLRTRHLRLGATPLTHVGAHVYIAGSNCMYWLTSGSSSFLPRLAPGLGAWPDVLAAAAALVQVLAMVAVVVVPAGAELACALPLTHVGAHVYIALP